MSGGFESSSQRFFELSEVPEMFEAPTQALRLLLLADDRHPAGVVQDHIRSIYEHSQHKVTVVNSRHVIQPDLHQTDDFDAILIHYSIFAISESYLSGTWQNFISSFRGVVAVIHEDEYQKINAFKHKFAELGVRAVFSCLDSKKTLEAVYGDSHDVSTVPVDTIFFSCLPGYIAPYSGNIHPPKIDERTIDVIYRGRTLSPELGRLGQEKRLIGEHMQSIARSYGLRYDISSAEQDRIYGSEWPLFLQSGKAMLGVEGGASIFDYDGKISAAVAEFKMSNPDASFEEIWQSVLRDYEGNIDFRTITPKFFEAIRAKTVLVLYPGKYNNLLLPDRHYIPLERDGSNAADVVAKLRNDAYLQEMADRTFDEIIHRHDLSSQFYVNQIDRVLWGLSKSHPTQLMQLRESLRKIQYKTQQELASIQREFASTQQKLTSTQQELVSTQQDLTSTRQELASTQQRFNLYKSEFDLLNLHLHELDKKVSSEAHLAQLLITARSKIKRLFGITK